MGLESLRRQEKTKALYRPHQLQDWGLGENWGKRRRATQKINLQGRRQNQENHMVESVIFIPHTPGGLLRQNLGRMEENLALKGRMRYIEECGSSI